MNNSYSERMETANEVTAFRCPNCEMAAEFCGECSQFDSDGKCGKYGHYTTADHWACPWARY